ncbi:MFS general substrate transporter [Athelia psychrophila]|uniref:MFS general substrate transporter n=1 Tax=Athelia psychrophila TaxID=1759441 RepID=A0A166S4W6_9AGAM|nr:MFS general substrate transporter [Fibularhizoctonia sp. CBS 109695]
MTTTTTTHEKPDVEVYDKAQDERKDSYDEKRTIDQLNVASKQDVEDESDLKVEREATRAAITQPSADDDFPDGGWRAWLVVFGTMSATFSTFGYVNAWGVFQAYYEETILKDSSPSSIAWIGSIQVPGLVTGRLFDRGYFKVPLFAASCLLVVATVLVAECTQYWQFLLCQGFAIGLSCGTIFGPCMGISSHWFKKRRGIALGLQTVGSSIGGTVFPIAAKRLIGEVGFPWTMRIIGLILIVTLGAANLTLKHRLPPSNSAGGLLNLAAFKNLGYTVWCASGFVAFMGLYTVLTYIDVSAVSVGVEPDFSFYLISIANAASGFGRIGAGFAADRFGAINVMAPATLLAGLLTFVWPLAHTRGSLVAVAIIYGFGSGAYVSLFAVPMMAFGEMHDVGRRVGMAMTILALGALAGPPISGAINNATGGFSAVGYFAG